MSKLNNIIPAHLTNGTTKTNAEAFFCAVSFARLDMVSEKYGDAIGAINRRIAKLEKLEERTKEQETALQGEKANLTMAQNDQAKVNTERDEYAAVYNTVLENIVSDGNDRDAIIAALRLIASFKNESLCKYVFSSLEYSAELNDAMTTIFESGRFGKNGAHTMSKDVKKAYETAFKVVKDTLRGAVSVKKNAYFTGLNLNINQTNMGDILGQFRTSISHKYTDDKIAQTLRKFSGVKKDKDGNVTNARAFWEACAKVMLERI